MPHADFARAQVKPFQSRELLARVRVHLTLGRMRHELETRGELLNHRLHPLG